MWTPMVHTLMKAPNNKETNDKLKARYLVLVGKLLWTSNTIQPDITFAVNTLACHMSKPTKGAMQVALWVVNYLNQMHNKVLRLGSKNKDEPPIAIYTDSNWASDLNMNRRSTSGSIVKVFSSMVTWSSHIQKCVSDLAIKAEYVAGLAATHEVLFHQHLLQGLGFGDHMLIVFMDNTRCIQVVKDQAIHSRLKHINTKYHLIQNHILEGDIVM
ncbi:hypothetical protein NDA11_006714 [Ustilago hordei]|uniref:Reverse transcriptase Ty1/copia-type domain-containing protein n=1 Tax=Ustilago hordei TaxID=120017 RepID=I2FND8_USTHO|nr:uncharacterized protein UHO2_07049 [Ustilago hordei]KAJ1572385.1 hypothetical protein NDA11_006714 [Ustilago hordei]KAJ1591398.1 hypothetical protein NDA15_003773 [Ustilago hordei]KAJ1593713.1 hypothetical protein NDA12_007173 [Ustilago hordei]KAJ1604077.1 hypothetical protein NDA14_007861 [Ustilago hordei]UTT88468.1 hypothetical protein NDA17_005213 [Ustilago hordei]